MFEDDLFVVLDRAPYYQGWPVTGLATRDALASVTWPSYSLEPNQPKGAGDDFKPIFGSDSSTFDHKCEYLLLITTNDISVFPPKDSTWLKDAYSISGLVDR